MHRWQVPQWSASGASGSSSAEVRIAPRNSHEPNSRETRFVCLPCQPRPAASPSGFSISGAVSTNTFTSAPLSPRQHAGHALEPGFHDVMVVAALGVAGDRPAARLCQRRQRIVLRRVVHAEHDDRARVRPHAERMPAALGRGGHPGHVAVPALPQELLEPLGDGRADGGRRRHAGRIEARSARFRQHQLFETFVHG